MSKDTPFDEEAICDICKVEGAFDFMGDHFCQACLDRFKYEYYDKESD